MTLKTGAGAEAETHRAPDLQGPRGLPAQAPGKNFETMNGLRGVAALVVVLFHQSGGLSATFLQHGYLAVDLFFVLSGFVIAHAYERRIKSGLGLWEFVKIRLIRFYPLYIIGVAISALPPLISIVEHHGILAQNHIFYEALPFAALLFPDPMVPNLSYPMYPLNSIAWSLFIELIVNVLYAATINLWSTRNIIILIFISGLLLLLNPLFYGDGGWNWASLHWGLIRAIFSFFAGVLILRLNSEGRLNLPRLNGLLIVILFAALILIPGIWGVRFCVLIGFPTLVAFAARSEPSRVTAIVFEKLGAASYAAYSVHVPLYSVLNNFIHKYNITVSKFTYEICFIGFMIPFCIILDHHVDIPLRRALARFFLKPRAATIRSSTFA